QPGYFFEDPAAYEPEGVQKRWKEDAGALVTAYADRLAAVEPFDAGSTEAALRALAEERGVGAGRIINPVRLARSGGTCSPSLFHRIEVLGRETVLRRLRRSVEALG